MERFSGLCEEPVEELKPADDRVSGRKPANVLAAATDLLVRCGYGLAFCSVAVSISVGGTCDWKDQPSDGIGNCA